MAAPPEAQLFRGQTLDGRYAVHDLLGVGGFSLVFRAVDLVTNEAVALKVLRPGVGAAEQLEFETEIDLLTRALDKTHVIDIRGTGKDTIQVKALPTGAVVPIPIRFAVLELADAAVVDLLAHRTAVGWSDRLKLYRDVLKGVHQLHQLGIVHRDLNAGNGLILSYPGGEVRAKVSDLGRSAALDDDRRFPSQAYEVGRGDLRYAPPEFVWGLGDATGATFYWGDLYLLGSLLFEMATGQGITSMAIPDVHARRQHAMGLGPDERKREFVAQLPNLRAQFELPFDIFAREVPGPMRHEASHLVRRLCDPDPVARGRGLLGRIRDPRSLEWLLRRVDIMQLCLRVAERDAACLERKRSRRRARRS